MPRLAALVPKFVLLPIAGVLATATLTFAATRPAQPAAPAAPGATPPADLIVPDVSGQAYVFAKGILEDAGFAWRVSGSVGGYAANLVATQSPAAGTRVVDTGSPVITLTLAASGSYAADGEPENASPYPGTAVELAALPKPAAPLVRAQPKPAAPKPAKPQPAATPATPAPAAPKAASRAKPATTPAPAQSRPADFVVAGAPKEPLDEVSLVERVRRLDAWLTAHPTNTAANANHWLYQHAWIVTGARFGWWRGEEALVALVKLDRRVQKLWGIGAESEQVARDALAEVRAKKR